MIDHPFGQITGSGSLRFDRFYPHPRPRVWEALTRSEHLDAWLEPGSRINARPGGRFRLGASGPAGASSAGTIVEFRPPEVLEYAFDDGERLRFELSAVPDGTRVVIVHSLPPGFAGPGSTGQPADDLPGGLMTPERPDLHRWGTCHLLRITVGAVYARNCHDHRWSDAHPRGTGARYHTQATGGRAGVCVCSSRDRCRTRLRRSPLDQVRHAECGVRNRHEVGTDSAFRMPHSALPRGGEPRW